MTISLYGSMSFPKNIYLAVNTKTETGGVTLDSYVYKITLAYTAYELVSV